MADTRTATIRNHRRVEGSDPAAIARRLDTDEMLILTGMDPTGHLAAYMPTLKGAFGLAHMGLVTRHNPGADREIWRLTPLGQAVRAELARMEARNAK